MKLFLEEDEDYIDEEGKADKRIKFVKEVKDKEEAIKDKKKNKSYLHRCYHDEKHNRPCKREIL